ncbi:MAG: polyhydroxyalkanoate synthesis repressor PhaR [Novosphingobium lindaniclasticum]|jgi:polyhydroxyalkanoate synthesis repressor PhaR|uniref:Polyhydroxyalkanoate synthesis repressor PhaR n=1 Tax=Novosphingobium lindaniclasticum LE124 TaxID=1096930 RepID=T0HRC8_9SPHN|nr:polyhydroxyalkanoate synthesis repressor PhaR [Novosphingobium lindaniclasticum]EQB18901.1 polyhydroxyalkanoate synthesis repressor PhaR [Novosphingobium lindaniclasticum LE124]MDF2639831.1 polyhydroxyalkanoate synthesis repressor PhaR [Novosphingobium lindaniclasticum]
MAETASQDDNTVIIKKYANRRLYNTRSSSYITLDHLAKMTREGVDYKVLDAKTGTDITHTILTQIIMEEESNGEQMLPVNFLRELISMYGNSMQSLVPHYLEASMDNFRANQTKLHKAFEDSLGNNPLAKLAEQNMAMFKAAASAFMPGAEKPEPKAPPAEDAGDLAALRDQMAEIQKRLDALGK